MMNECQRNGIFYFIVKTAVIGDEKFGFAKAAEKVERGERQDG